MICPACKSEVPNEAVVCTNCGAMLPQMPVSPHQDTKSPFAGEGSSFSSGSPYTAPPAYTTPTAEMPKAQDAPPEIRVSAAPEEKDAYIKPPEKTPIEPSLPRENRFDASPPSAGDYNPGGFHAPPADNAYRAQSSYTPGGGAGYPVGGASYSGGSGNYGAPNYNNTYNPTGTPPPPPTYAPYTPPRPRSTTDEHMTIGKWIGFFAIPYVGMLIPGIPFIGMLAQLILLFVFAFGNTKYLSFKSFCRALLLLFLIGIVLVVVIVAVFSSQILEGFSEFQRGFQDGFYNGLYGSIRSSLW